MSMEPGAHRWRYRCPQGHVDVVERRRTRHRGGPEPESRCYCRTCKDTGENAHYSHEVDAKTERAIPE